MARSCVFCGGRPVTREHVWPRWIGRELEALGGGGDFKSTRHEEKWVTTKIDQKVKRFCARCNNGWMSQLEGGVQPILGPMITSNSGTFTFPPHEQRILAQWAYKTALVADFALIPDSDHTPIPDDAYREFYDTKTPPTTAWIWIAAYGEGTRAIHGARSEHYFKRQVLLGNSLESDDDIRLYAITFSAYRVVFQILGFLGTPFNDFPVTLDHPMVLRLWPPNTGSAEWPPGGKALSTTGLEDFALRSRFF